jgi:hypothetical protein
MSTYACAGISFADSVGADESPASHPAPPMATRDYELHMHVIVRHNAGV